MNNIVASEGAAKTTMCALLLGAVLNIGLDPVFIYAFDMGVAGAAIATSISQFVSTLVYLTYALRKKSAFSFSIKDFKPSKQIYMEVLKIGVPTLTFQLLTSLSIALINRAANGYGDAAIAGMGAVTRVLNMDEKGGDGIDMDDEPENDGEQEELDTEEMGRDAEAVADAPFKPQINRAVSEKTAEHRKERILADSPRGRISVKEKLAEMRQKAYGQKAPEKPDISKGKGKEESL